mgnify:FL=1
MISYGSQICSALMPYSARSHQLGKGQINHHRNVIRRTPFPTSLWEPAGQRRDAIRKSLPPVRGGSIQHRNNARTDTPFPISLWRPKIRHRNVTPTPPPPVRGGSKELRNNAKMVTPSSISFTEATSFKPKGQSYIASKGKGQETGAEMPYAHHPSQLVLRGPKILHRIVTRTPPPPFYGSLCYHAAMPIYGRSHLFTRGQLRFAEMPFIERLSREGSSCPRSNAIHGSPFPTSLWKEHQ